MTAGRRIFVNIRAMGAARVATLLSGLISTGWTARALGPDYFGVLGFGTSLLAYAAIFVNLGLSTYALREIARDSERAADLADHVLTMRTLLALLTGGLYALFVMALDRPMLVKAVLLVQVVQLLGNALVLDFVYQATERMSVIAMREVGTAVGIALATVLLVHRPDDAPVAAAITGGSILLNALLMLHRYRRDFRPPRPRIDLTAWRAMLATSAPMAISVFAWALFSQLDLVMLGFMVPHGEVGQYAAAAKLVTLSSTAGLIIMNAFMPQLAAAHGDLEQVRARMRDYATTVLTVGGLIAAGGVALAPAILGVIFGAAYAPATDSLRLLMISVAFSHVNLALGNPLLVWHRQTAYMTAILIGGAANAAFNLVLIPRMGIEGSAVATILAQGVCMSCLAWHHHRAVGRIHLNILLKSWVCGGLAVAAVSGLCHTLPNAIDRLSPLVVLLAGGALVVATYALAALATGLIRPSRLRRLITATV